MLGAATIIPLPLLMPHCLAAMQKPDIFFQVALLEPAASMFYPTDLKRHNERNVTSIRRLPACRHRSVGVRGLPAHWLDNADVGSSARR
jgi:hypothetical protein